MTDFYDDIYWDVYGEIAPPGEFAVEEFSEELYQDLPEIYRQYDALESQDYAFKKFIASWADQAGEISTLLDRFWYETEEEGGPGFVQGADGNCDLANPNRADAAWLPWMSQVLGVSLKGLVGATAEETIAKQRDWLDDPAEARLVGSKAALIRLAKSALSGTQYLDVLDHTTDVGGIGEGGEWDVCLVYRPDEFVSDPAAAVIAAGAKPAGWMLRSREASSTWGYVRDTIGTWGAVKALGSWRDVYLDGI